MLENIKSIVKAAGQIIINAHNIQQGIESKQGSANFVTRYDLEVQNYLYQELSNLYPNATFMGEEDKMKLDRFGEYCFIIDPIDGTTNFIFDYRHSAISIGLLHNGYIEVGVVYNPFLDELFYAERGKGSFLNGRPLFTINLSLSEGIVGFGTSPYYREKAEESFLITRKLFDKALDIRRSGSAALDICYVAANRYVLFFELLLSPWDYAGASLIVKEAGGIISTMEGKGLSFNAPNSLIVATPTAYDEFFRL